MLLYYWEGDQITNVFLRFHESRRRKFNFPDFFTLVLLNVVLYILIHMKLAMILNQNRKPERPSAWTCISCSLSNVACISGISISKRRLKSAS